MTDSIKSIDLTKLQNYVDEVKVGMLRRKDATSFIRDVMEAAKADGFKPKEIRNLAKLALSADAAEQKAEMTELLDKAEALNI